MRSLRTHLTPRFVSLSLALSFALALNALAEAPKTMNAQGVLRDGSGAVVADGDHTVVFKLYETATGGSAIWEESQLLGTSNGLFNAVLGNTTSLAGLDFESPYYMAMTVDGGSEMSPRIPLTAVAYSFLAHNVSDGSVTSSKIVDGAVNGLKLADDAVSTSKMEDGAVTSSKLASDASVLSLNTLKGDVTLAASGGATIQTDGNTIMINAGSGTGTEAGVQGIQNTDGTMTVADANGPTVTLGLSDGGVSTAKLAEDAVTASKIADESVVKSLNGLTDGVTLQAGTNIDMQTSGSTITISSTGGVGSGWDLSGNTGTDANLNFLGTTDNEPFVMRVDNQRVLLVEPPGTAPNWIAGYGENDVINGVAGATVAGGGANNGRQQIVEGNFGTIGGGLSNRAGKSATVAGGFANEASGDRSAVGGGRNNVAAGLFSTVAGGGPSDENDIENTRNIAGSDYSTVGGGGGNIAGDPNLPALNPYITVSGGKSNNAVGDYATIGGGNGNGTGDKNATVSGGLQNFADDGATVGGGISNAATGLHSVIGGGANNSAKAQATTIAGGEQNEAFSTAATVGGGNGNTSDGFGSTIGGGNGNTANAEGTTISGGFSNTASQTYATVGGGQGNQATDDFTTVAGGKSNKAGTNFAFVGGGENNEAIAIYTTVSGGELNFARVPHTTIGGGKDNDARASFSTISGGESNQTSGVHATVPGGQANIASGDYSFAAGRNSIVTAIAPGSFVWSDASSSIGFTANSSNLFLIRATGGVGIGTENPSADLHVAGDIIADGTITKPSGVILADHPLNPETQFLVHQEVSSSQMLNVYNGNAVLDGSGRAWVELPEWFEAYNKDFRYQLTCIGGHAPVFVASEVSGNRFQIAGGKSGMKVSWEITGVRNDAYAKSSTREVTPYKTPEQVGRYVTPEAFGAPASSALSASSGNE